MKQYGIEYETFGFSKTRYIEAKNEEEAVENLKKLLKRKRLFEDFKVIEIIEGACWN